VAHDAGADVILAVLLAAATSGKLVVLVVVDQLRYQDLLWLEPEFGPRGFAGLGRPSPMRYDTVVTETAADHAVLATGAYPDLSGIIGDRFWEGGREREAVDDPACPVWGLPQRGRSASALRVPTVGDAFKLNTPGAGRVVAVAVKDRAALFLVGPSADLALWFETETGQMASSTCYAPAPPEWVPRDLAASFREWTWTMSRPDAIARLQPLARVPGAIPLYEMGAEFPHRVGTGALDNRFFSALRNSPASSTLALQTARAAVKALQLGESGKTDYLTLALSAVDGVGHQFGTLARERIDTILRMHEDLGAFLDELRARLGPRLSVMLTSDHGLTPMEADQKRLRVTQGGTENIDELVPRIESALVDQLGPRPGGWVASIDGSALSLRPPFPPSAVRIAVELLRQEPGLWRVVPASEVDAAEPAVRHAYFPGRSGQVLLVPRPLWTLRKHSAGANHGSPWNDDALVPLLIQSSAFHLRHDGVFRATQVAPTVAALLDTSPPAAALDLPAIEH